MGGQAPPGAIYPFFGNFMKDLKIFRAFGLRIREIRRARGFTQEKLAEKAGLHWKFISLIETGKSDVTLTTISRLAYAFGMEISEFFLAAFPAHYSEAKERLVAEILSVIKEGDDRQAEGIADVVRAAKKF